MIYLRHLFVLSSKKDFAVEEIFVDMHMEKSNYDKNQMELNSKINNKSIINNNNHFKW